MGDGTLFDIVLFGFRNDVARARALEYLAQLPPAPSGPSSVAGDTVLPQRLFAGLEHTGALQLQAALEDLGAQVTLVRVVPTPTPASLIAAPAAERASGIRPLTLLLVLLLGGTAYVWRASVQHPAPARLPAQLQPQPEGFNGTADSDEPAVMQSNDEAIHLAQAAQFREAEARLEAALRLSPGHPVLTRNLQTVLLNWGIANLNADKLDDAADHLQQADRLGERAEVLRALGVTYVRQADYARASPILERALQLIPADTGTLLALSETYIHEDKRPAALDLLERAKDAGASGPEIDKRVQQLSREVDAEWDFVQLENAHFRISFADDDDRSMVSTVLDALDDAYFSVGSKFDYYPDGRTPVVLYTQQDFHSITRTPDWAGGAFDGRIKIPVRGLTRNDPNLPRTARHEYAHRIIAELSAGRCPVWLNEGLAVWAEEDADGERQSWAESRIANRELFTLDALDTSFIHLPADRVEAAYAESYLAVRSLIDRYGTQKIPALLTALAHAHDLNDAFASVYPDQLSWFQERLLRSLSGRG